MVARIVIGRQIEIELRSIELMLGDLAEVASEWSELSGAERASWSLDWDQLMYGDLALLGRRSDSGELGAEQKSRFENLKTRLRAARPTLERVGLSIPAISLET